MSEKAYQPREYKTFASAKRAGKRECMKRGILSFSVYRLWSNILVVGTEEHNNWNAYVNEHEIPIHIGDCYTVFVWQARKKDERAVELASPPNGARDTSEVLDRDEV